MSKRGLWFEKKYKRWRVRLYRHGTAYLAGYFKTKAEGETALEALKKRLKEVKEPEKMANGVMTI